MCGLQALDLYTSCDDLWELQWTSSVCVLFFPFNSPSLFNFVCLCMCIYSGLKDNYFIMHVTH